MYMLMEMPAVCLCIVLYILYYYRQNGHLKTEGASCYMMMIWCTALSLVSHILLLAFLTMDENRYRSDAVFWQNLQLLAVMTMGVLFYWYVLNGIEAGQRKRHLAEKLVLLALWLFFAVMIAASPVRFNRVRMTYGALGRKVVVTYIAVLVFSAGILIHGIIHRKYVAPKQYRAMLEAFVLFLVIATVQTVIPYLMLLGFAQTMVLLVLLLSMENPEHYLDGRSGLFNGYAFESMMTEKLLLRKRSFAVFACALNNDVKENTEVTDRAMVNAAKYMQRHYRMRGYRLTESILVFVEEGLIRPVGKIDPKDPPDFTEGFEGLRQHEMLFHYPKDCADYDAVMNKVAEFKLQNSDAEAFMDMMTGVFNRNRYEHDAPLFAKERERAWCLVVDINNLKVTNDKFGHEAGDDLIITVAHLLQDVFSGHGYVYRTGGDEFTIVYLGDTVIEEKIAQLKEGCRRKNVKRSLPLKFAVGCAQYVAGGADWQDVVKTADARMYENKIKSKQKE